RTPDFTG
ncbi:putative tail length tape measure protein, partial [Escherichia coli 93.0055]